MSRTGYLALAFSAAVAISGGTEFGHGSTPTHRSAAADCQVPQAPTASSESISCTTPRANTVVWRIDRPNVQQGQTIYPSITFQIGDLVSVFAGGCVQHGGLGLTWKRYVNPMSLDRSDDDSHHGIISVPGFGALRHIRDALLQGGIPILADPGPDAFLVLGYSDDGNGDDGYYSRDDGLWQQCNDLPDAWVVIAIQHGCAASASPECVRGRALDIVSDTRDDNGFPINPDWVYRRLTGTSPVASSVCGWSTKIAGMPVDNASLCVGQSTNRDFNGDCVKLGTAGGIAGHMNWSTAVNYQGWIWWDGHDYYFDDDYTLNVAALDATKHVAGSLFLDGENNPQVEFNSDETIDDMGSTPWWDRLRGAVNTEDQVLHTANAVATGSPRPSELFAEVTEAIVIGQLGLDCAHSCNSEIHPAAGLFLHVKDDINDDTWAFFARNWGNEGFCSSDDHRLLTRQITVRLPRRFASDVQLHPSTVVGMTKPTAPWTVALTPGGGAALATFNLPTPDQHGMVYGELHLCWRLTLPTETVGSKAEGLQPLMVAKRPSPLELTKAEHGPEEELTRKLDKLPRVVRESLVLRRLPHPRPLLQRLVGRVVKVREGLGVRKAAAIRIVQVPRKDSRATIRRAQALRVMTHAGPR